MVQSGFGEKTIRKGNFSIVIMPIKVYIFVVNNSCFPLCKGICHEPSTGSVG